MSGTPRIYANHVPEWRGNVIDTASSCTWGNENADADVSTIVLGWDGASKGATKMVVKFTIHIPIGGSLHSELLQAEEDMSIEKVGVQEWPNGKKMKLEGLVRNVSGEGSVGSVATVTGEWHCKPGKFE